MREGGRKGGRRQVAARTAVRQISSANEPSSPVADYSSNCNEPSSILQKTLLFFFFFLVLKRVLLGSAVRAPWGGVGGLGEEGAGRREEEEKEGRKGE